MLIQTHSDQNVLNEIEIVEHHFHERARWFGKKAVQTATEWGVSISTGLTLLYRAISGEGIYGTDTGDEAQLFGSADVFLPGSAYFDPHEILIVANSASSLYLNRLVWGSASEALASAVAAGKYTEFPYFRGNADNVRKTASIVCPRISVGSKLWMQTMNATDNATIDFIIGVHTYTE